MVQQLANVFWCVGVGVCLPNSLPFVAVFSLDCAIHFFYCIEKITYKKQKNTFCRFVLLYLTFPFANSVKKGEHAFALKFTFTHHFGYAKRWSFLWTQFFFFLRSHTFSHLFCFDSHSLRRIYLSSAALFTFCFCMLESGHNCKYLSFFFSSFLRRLIFFLHVVWIFNVLLLHFFCHFCT